MGSKPLRDEQKRFEVVIYNRIGGDLVERNESQKDLKDESSDKHYQEISSSSAKDALRKIEMRYPAKKNGLSLKEFLVCSRTTTTSATSHEILSC